MITSEWATRTKPLAQRTLRLDKPPTDFEPGEVREDRVFAT